MGVTDAEAIAHLQESIKRFGELTSQMTDEEYATVKAEYEEAERMIEAILREAK